MPKKLGSPPGRGILTGRSWPAALRAGNCGEKRHGHPQDDAQSPPPTTSARDLGSFTRRAVHLFPANFAGDRSFARPGGFPTTGHPAVGPGHHPTSTERNHQNGAYRTDGAGSRLLETGTGKRLAEAGGPHRRSGYRRTAKLANMMARPTRWKSGRGPRRPSGDLVPNGEWGRG